MKTHELMDGELAHLRACERALLEIRDIALGSNSDPLFSKWLGDVVSSPAAIPGLVRDRMAEIDALSAQIVQLRAALYAFDLFVKSIHWRDAYMGYPVKIGEVSYDTETFSRIWKDIEQARAALDGGA